MLPYGSPEEKTAIWIGTQSSRARRPGSPTSACVVGAIVIYVVGRWLIAFVISLLRKVLTRQKLDPTLLRFFGDTISVILFSDNIQNYLTNTYRRVDLNARIAGETEPQKAFAAIKERVSRIPNVLAKPAPDVVILSFTGEVPALAVRPYCSNANYWQVYFRYEPGDPRSTRRRSFPAADAHLRYPPGRGSRSFRINQPE